MLTLSDILILSHTDASGAPTVQFGIKYSVNIDSDGQPHLASVDTLFDYKLQKQVEDTAFLKSFYVQALCADHMISQDWKFNAYRHLAKWPTPSNDNVRPSGPLHVPQSDLEYEDIREQEQDREIEQMDNYFERENNQY